MQLIPQPDVVPNPLTVIVVFVSHDVAPSPPESHTIIADADSA